jgi:tetratricopeptide (TPR) repeat protein
MLRFTAMFLLVCAVLAACAAHPNAELVRAQAAMQSANYMLALQEFRAAGARDARSLEAKLGEGAALVELGSLKEAQRVLESTLSDHPNNVTVLYNVGIVQMQRGQFRGAVRRFSAAIEINPRWADLYWNRGTAYDELAEWDNAIADYNEAIRLDPSNADVFNNRAKTRLSMQDLEGAMSDIDEALRLNPRHPKAPGIKRDIEARKAAQ